MWDKGECFNDSEQAHTRAGSHNEGKNESEAIKSIEKVKGYMDLSKSEYFPKIILHFLLKPVMVDTKQFVLI